MHHDLAKSKLEAIAQELSDEKYLDTENIGIYTGLSGIALFLFHYHSYSNKDIYALLGKQYILKIINKISRDPVLPTYCDGLAGALWTIEYLNENEFIEFSTDKNFKSIDSYLYEVMNIDAQNGEFDVLHGALGYGYYFLKRFKNTKSARLRKQYLKWTVGLVEALNAHVKSSAYGTYWENKLLQFSGTVDLGLAHGMSGIISYLTKLLKYGISSPLIENLLSSTISFVLSCKTTDLNSRYPYRYNLTDTNHSEPIASRLAWCYGDLGIATTLLNTSKWNKSESLYTESIEIMYHNLKRKAPEDTKVIDAGLCHGSIGITMMYKHFFESTQDESFKQNYQYWFEDSLSKATFTDGLAGFKKRADLHYINEPNFLEGIAGIGLGILSIVSNQNTSWQECLMIK